MTNNDIFRRIRYIFNYNDAKMVSIFALAGHEVERQQITAWLKKDDDPEFQACNDQPLSQFLNGFIIEKRGKQNDEPPKTEKSLNNNLILRKLKIALELQSDDIIALLKLAGLPISPHELSAFFRRPDHKHYRPCKDQILRNFLFGLQAKYRDQPPPAPQPYRHYQQKFSSKGQKKSGNSDQPKTQTKGHPKKPQADAAPAQPVKNPTAKKAFKWDWKPPEK